MARNGSREYRQDQLRFDTSGQASKKVPDPGSTAVIVHQASKRQFIQALQVDGACSISVVHADVQNQEQEASWLC